ncbi:MAG: Ig-like domain-containing protein, partial [Bifidobacteriaceae bacterium]|nr:Ig-like domain-containing protein [Bifidobacteriaceae bacterium]
WHACAFYAGDQIVGGSPAPVVFSAGALEPALSVLEVSQNLALADGEGAHYAKVWARDALGNPLGGIAATVSIETGAAGVPGPAVKGGTAASATVSTCDPDWPAAAPEWCVEDGVFQAGLALVEFTSTEPGTFLVSASLGGLPAASSPLPVSFTSGPADALKSSWAIAPDTSDPVDGGAVSLPGTGLAADAYQLTVSARSLSNLLVAGAKVRLVGLDPAVQLSGPAEAVTGDPASGRLGQHTWALFSAGAGQYTGQVELWNDTAWVSLGAPFTVRFSEPDGVAPGAALVDPSDGSSVSGSVSAGDVADAAELVVVVEAADGSVWECPVAAGGGFECVIDPVLPDGSEVTVTLVDAAGNTSDPVLVVTDSTPPGALAPEPTDGQAVTGKGEAAGDSVTVKDENGDVICSTAVGADLTWTCELQPAAAVGDRLTIIEADSAGNELSQMWRVGLPRLEIARASLCAGESQVVDGINFQPGEVVSADAPGAPEGAKADADGRVRFEWATSHEAASGEVVVRLSGPLSGEVSGQFAIACEAGDQPPGDAPAAVDPILPFTGSQGVLALVGAALGAVLAGWLLLMGAARRRREQEM